MEANTAQNDLQAVHQLALPEAGQVQRPVDQVLSVDCQVQEQYDQVLPGEAEAGKQLEEGKDSLASGWRG